MSQQAKEKFLQVLLDYYSVNKDTHNKIYNDYNEFSNALYGELLEILKTCKNIYGEEIRIRQNTKCDFKNFMEQITYQACTRYSAHRSPNTEQFTNITNAIWIIYEID
jgi:hypothetical protein